VNALDLIPSEPVSSDTLAKAELYIKLNFGIDYPREKFAILFEQIDEAHWSEERFRRVFNWFLRTKKYSSWTIADWFEFGIKLYPYSWYSEQVNKCGKSVNNDIEVYDLGNKVYGYKYIDGNTLPFPRRKIGEKEWARA
jgi:hypothetical protein